MARVPYLDHTTLAPQDRELVWRRGNLYMALANSPEFTARFAQFGFYMNCASQIDYRMQKMVILTVASLVKSQFEWSAHVMQSTEMGLLTPEEIRALQFHQLDTVDSFSEKERFAAKFAYELVTTRAVTDATYAGLLSLSSDGYVVEISGLVGMYLGLAHIISALKIDVADEHLHWLDKYPLSQ